MAQKEKKMVKKLPHTPLGLIWFRFKQHRLAYACIWVMLGIVLLVVNAVWVEGIFGYDSNKASLIDKWQPSSMAHWMGTDDLGRDLFLRILYGGQISLFLALIGASISSLLGTTIGLISGYSRRLVDSVLMRFTDFVISLPLLPLLIILAAIDLTKLGIPEDAASGGKASLFRMAIIVSMFGWTTTARLVRSVTLSMRQREFVLAARAMGSSHTRILMRHILPNVISPIVVAMTLSISSIILLESTLSFLGLGIQPPMSSWGNMLSNALEALDRAPHTVFYPGLTIFITVISLNFIGDGLRDAIDPRSVRR